MIEPLRFPPIPHVSWSEGQSDSDYCSSYAMLAEDLHYVVRVSEKMDGENMSLTRSFIHARSPDRTGQYLSNPLYSWVKTLWGRIRHDIPDTMRIIGEYLAAEHSLRYEGLPDYFLVFCITDRINDIDIVLNWARTVEICDYFGLHTVPLLYTGRYNDSLIQEMFRSHPSKYQPDGVKEGIVIKTDVEFNYVPFGIERHIAKAVRRGHVQKTEKHWRNRKIVLNKLAGRYE